MAYKDIRNSKTMKVIIVVVCVILALAMTIPSVAVLLGAGKQQSTSDQATSQTQQAESIIPGESTSLEDCNAYYEKLISMLDGKVDDVWVAEAEDVIVVGETGRLMDLNTNDVLRERYSDRFVYCTPLDESYSDQPVPIGIDLTGTALVGEYSAYPGGAVLGVNAYTQRPDQVVVFLDYLFQ